MAQIPFRANTQTAIIPLLSELNGRTVIVPGQDQTYINGVNPGDKESPIERGIPQILFAANVMPSTYGLQSIGFNLKYAPTPSIQMESIYYIQATEDGMSTYLAVDSQVSGQLKVIKNEVWVTPQLGPYSTTPYGEISTATINGLTYICVSGQGVYTYNLATNTFTTVDIKGIEVANILGIVASRGYLVIYSETGINWSATTDPTDFVPSDVTGAGGGAVQEAKGKIVYCQETNLGFLVYTVGNVVSATFSSNVNFPWNFKDISGSGGVTNSDYITRDITGSQYAYTSSGLQKIFNSGAQTVLAYVTDFLSGRIYEYFSNGALIQDVLTQPLRKKITMVADRYLVLSYGPDQQGEMGYALILDLVQNRMGKVAINHIAAFELKDLSTDRVQIPKESIGFLSKNGKVDYVDLNTRSGADGIALAIFGKYQYVRQRDLELQEVHIENIQAGKNFTLSVMSTRDGKTWLPPVDGFWDQGDSPNPESQTRRYLFDIVGVNHTLIAAGSFNIISMVLNFNVHGKQ